MNILITGATGTIGREVIRHFKYGPDHTIFAAVHSAPSQPFAKPVELRAFDFQDLTTAGEALKDIDVVFLLRPPHIADVQGVFRPLILYFKRIGIQHVVFLSVQGAEHLPVIPHHKIERLLRESGIRFTFIRASYFMQNLTTTLRKDIARGEIYLPSGRARFNWVDAADIGRAIATVLKAPEHHVNQAYVITGREQLDFKEVADVVSRVTQTSIRFKSPSPLSFYFRKRREGQAISMIFVLIMLHMLPRFSKLPPLSDDYRMLTGREPGTLEQFARREMTGA